MATIKDVAKLAKVSTTTVSHVINKTRYVAQDTKQRVWDAIEVLNYSPSAIARSLKNKATRTIGFIITELNNAFFSEVIAGAERYCYKNGYTMILCCTQNEEKKQRDYLRMLAEKRVDGMIVMCSELNECLQTELDKYTDTPMVIMDWGPESQITDKIIDNADHGGYLATQYLIDNGHKNIGCITGPMDKLICKDRLKGFYKAMQDADLEINSKWIYESDFLSENCCEIAKEIATNPDKPTALFVFNDVMAFATISTLVQNGVRVPEDISIIGYDNVAQAAYFSPPLTTIHQAKRRLGKTAVELLFKRMQDKDHEPRTFSMEPEIVARKSVFKLN